MPQITDATLLARVDNLQRAYTHALERRNMEGWLATFDNPGSYELTTQEHVKHNLPVGMMLDDCYERLQDRCTYVNEVWNHAVEHYQPRYQIYRNFCEMQPDGAIHADTNVTLFYTGPDGHSHLLVVGHYHDNIIEVEGELKFRSRKAILDTAVPPRYLIYPV